MHLFFFQIFQILNLGGLPPELGEYSLNPGDIFLTYIVIINALYIALFYSKKIKKATPKCIHLSVVD